MDKEKYTAIGKELARDLDQLAKKYDLSNYGFMGFIGEPGKGHVPVCMHSVSKPQFKNHAHVQLGKMVFLDAVAKLAAIGGNAYQVNIDG